MSYNIKMGPNIFVRTSGRIYVEQILVMELRSATRAEHSGGISVGCQIQEAETRASIVMRDNILYGGAEHHLVEETRESVELYTRSGHLVFGVDRQDVKALFRRIPGHRLALGDERIRREVMAATAMLYVHGEFYAGPHHIMANETTLTVDGVIQAELLHQCRDQDLVIGVHGVASVP